ncbi:TolC family protein [Tunturiibacter gelidoferens]|uniref:TolC family protein n=1 Tax=Tunturiibacter gelidiferens TaxID=3069689 RepID=A0AAU7Z157_9BACT
MASVVPVALVSPILLLAQQSNAAAASEHLSNAASVDLTLSSAVEMALAHNRHIMLAHLAVTDSMSQKRLAESRFYPIIKNQSAVLHITELEGVRIPAGALGETSSGFSPAETLNIGQGALTSYTSGTELAQPITQIFKIRAGVKAADAELNSAHIQSDDAENGVAFLVHKLYYGILVEELRGAAAKDAVDAATMVEQEAKHGVNEGKLLADAELVSRTDLLDKQQAALASHLNLDDLTLQLDDALGLPLGTHLILDPNSFGASSILPTRADAIALLLNKSPAVLSARQTVEKAKADVAAARDEYIPELTGVARYSYQSGLPFLAHNFGTFGAIFTYTLFDGGGREAKLQDARIKLTMAQTQLKQTEADVSIELSSAYDKTEQLDQLVRVTTQALEAREESFRIQSERAKVDAQLASGVAAANAALTSAHMNLLNSQLNLSLARNNIRRLLGERPE